jgi:hypothetical protein
MVQIAKTLVKESTAISATLKAETDDALNAAKAALEARNGVLHAPVGGSLLEGKVTFWNGKRKRFKDDHPKAGELMAVHLGTEELDQIGASIHKAMDDLFHCGLRLKK